MNLSADEEFEFNLITEICINLYDDSGFDLQFWSSETGTLLERLNRLNEKRSYPTDYGELGMS